MHTPNNEIGFDGLPRFRTEIRTCSCGADFSVTWDRHSLDDGTRSCEPCRDLPSVSAEVIGFVDGRMITILPHHPTMVSGKRLEWCWTFDRLRATVARAKESGVERVQIRYTRHTKRLGHSRPKWVRV